MQETKAQIKERMLRSASAAWGYPEKIEEASFDPLLAILLDVYAAELEKISQEMGASRERVLQKMMQLMAPETFTCAEPAHAIAHAASVEGLAAVSIKDQFCTIPAAAEHESWFAPAGDFMVSEAVVRYQVAGLRCFHYPGPRQREFASQLSVPVSPCTLWLGIDAGGEGLPPTGFYFNLNHEEHREKFLFYLPAAEWYCGHQTLSAQTGLPGSSGIIDNVEGWLSGEDILGRRLLSRIQKRYNRQFVQLEEAVSAVSAGPLPVELSAILPQNVQQQSRQEKLIWIKVVFPEVITGSLLEDLYCQANCFPVLNRKLHQLTHRMQDFVNIIPLGCENQFLDLHSVNDEEGRSWLNPRQQKGEGSRRVLLRRTGANRFEERDAKKLIEQLLQLLREETVAFGLYGRDFVQQEMLALQQSMNRLQQKIAEHSGREQGLPFLEAASGEKHTLFVYYWSTEGKLANGLRPGTPLLAYRNGNLRQSSIVLVSASSDGRDELTGSSSIPVYKSALLSRDRIASEEDIRLFCLQQIGGIVQRVAVTKGVSVGAGPQSGYQKTIDVHISIQKTEWLDLHESDQLHQLSDRLERSLTERSLAMMPFRIFLKAA